MAASPFGEPYILCILLCIIYISGGHSAPGITAYSIMINDDNNNDDEDDDDDDNT